ncbi:MAG: hypothetical protein ACE5I7_09760 [Candidatus Binatia bacterium]
MAKYEDLICGENALPATTGRAWVFGDHITRRQVLGDAYLHRSPAVACAGVMAAVDPQFAQRVAVGDFLVAGLDFAADATRCGIAATLKALGIAAVIARSFGPAFLRDALHAGLPAAVVEETGAIKTGDSLRLDVEAHVVANLSSGDRYVIRNLDDDALDMLRAGGQPHHG